MSDPTRLLSGEASDFEKELLGSWGSEQPSDASRAKVLAMVGAGAAVGVAAVAGKVGAAAGGSIAPKVGATGAAAIAKWLVLGALGVATAGATLELGRRARHETPVAAAPTMPATLAPKTVEPPAAPAEGTPTPVEDSTSTAPATQEAARSVAPQRRSSATERGARSSDPGLGEQVSALDRARRALADGDAPAALRQLDDYEARFPRGALVEEAEVLRVESLLAEGDRASAARVGGRFLATHPDSPHAARLRSLLGQSPGP